MPAVLLSLAINFVAQAKPSADQIRQLLPREIGIFRQVGPVQISERPAQIGLLQPRAIADPDFFGAITRYVSADGGLFIVEVARFSQDSDAYSSLTIAATSPESGLQINGSKLNREVGTASLVTAGRVAFFKGRTCVRVTEVRFQNNQGTITLARLLADRLEKGEGDIPVLVKHLPQWEEAQERVVYLARFRSLNGLVANQPVLEAVNSEGDADAVAASYGSSQFLIVEFNTPQLAGDNDRSIVARIQELRSQGQPVPSAYRRVGNYSVFVFNAPSEQAANQLIDQVKYEQLVQWLGENPNILARAQREYYQTTAGVLVAVVKASGLSLLACLAIGGFFGALLFSRRRAQQQAVEAYSDAGGMLRLNIDEMTPETDSAKLLGPGN